MSVFKKLKGTFQNAQQDIVEGFRALTSLDTQSRLDQLRSVRARDINLDAGADLLHSYQKNWSSIQTDTKESAKKAEEVNSLLNPLFKVWDRQYEAAASLEEEVKAIPNILSTLEKLHTLLDGLRQDFVVAEKGLDVLENLCEEQEFKSRCLEEQRKLAAYRVQKEVEAERVKVDLAKAHAKKMAELESAKRLTLQDRAEAFTSAFQDDVNYYRTHGHPGRLPTEFPKVTSLSEIVIDEDKQALDSFLGPGGEPEGAQGNLELSGEVYIEDDYITDYSVKRDVEFVEDPAYISDKVISELIQDDGDDYAEEDEEAEGAHQPQNAQNSESLGHAAEHEAKGKTDTESHSADASENTKNEDIKTSSDNTEAKQSEGKGGENMVKVEDSNSVENAAENSESTDTKAGEAVPSS